MDNSNLSPYSPGYAEERHVDTSMSSMHASLTNSCWPSSQVSPIHQNSLFSLQNRVSDLDYPSPASSVPSPPYQPHPHQHAAVNNSAITSDKVIHSSFLQVDSAIGPDRVMTRRQRAAHDQSNLGRRMSVPSNFTKRDRQSLVPRHQSDLYCSRPQTPVAAAQAHHDPLSLSIDSALHSGHSPSYKPMTPTSIPSPYSPYSYYPGQPRSDPGAQTVTVVEQRQGSPSNSITSSGTTYEGGPIRTSATQLAGMTTRKNKKQRLCNAQRKDICEYAEKNPNSRQEDMAHKWGIERSTVSKILKNKEKWLRLPQDDLNYISKQRNSKFPGIEADLEPWLEECHKQQVAITDSLIRNKAKEVAQKHCISEDKFKASSGWIENFKLRQGIKNGKLTGDGKDARLRHIYAMTHHNISENGSSSSVRESHPQATDGRLSNDSTTYQPWNYSQPDRAYSALDVPSIMQDSSSSEEYVRNDALFPAQMSSGYLPNIEQAYEALARLRNFLNTYHRREYLINFKDEDVLRKLAQKIAQEIAGTTNGKA